MSEHSRRNFLKSASIGTAAVGAVAILPSMTSANAAAPRAHADADGAAASGPAHDGPFTVWVKDARTGEIAVLVGEREVVHHDRALARTLAKIAARGTKA